MAIVLGEGSCPVVDCPCVCRGVFVHGGGGGGGNCP